MLREDGDSLIICRVMKIGVLDIQGSVEEHFEALRVLADERTDVEPVLVKKASDFEGLDGLVIPGGESTTVSKLLKLYGMDREIVALVKRGGKVFGTCAGAIVLATNIVDEKNGAVPLGLIDIDVDRNAYGRQLDSFETILKFNDKNVPGVFIRAPVITRVGDGCEVLIEFEGKPVLVRQGNVLVATFHPEMSGDLSIYNWFFL